MVLLDRIAQTGAAGVLAAGAVLSGVEVNPTALNVQIPSATQDASTLMVEAEVLDEFTYELADYAVESSGLRSFFVFSSAHAGESITTVIGPDGHITCGVTAGESGGGGNAHISLPIIGSIGGGGHSHGSHPIDTVQSGALAACQQLQFERAGAFETYVSGVKNGGSIQEVRILLGSLMDRLGTQASPEERGRWNALLNDPDASEARLRDELWSAYLAVESVESGVNRILQRSQSVPPTQAVQERGPVPTGWVEVP